MTTHKARWDILYRGPLSSCNYACDYCPFAKTKNTRAELDHDAACLERFVGWVAGREERIGVLFTPWGEALIRSHYRRALLDLSHFENVSRVAIQTNLSGPLEWLANADHGTLALWTTWHPSQVSLERFVRQCRTLDALNVRYSVGVVGLREHFTDIARLRRALRPGVYVWVNAYKRREGYYAPAEVAALSRIDPLFLTNNRRHLSFGESCRTGATSFTVDGDGDVRRCHFVGDVLGNLYQQDVTEMLSERTCPNATCGCHIGYVHLDRLGLYPVFGEGLLERIPAEPLWVR